MASRTDTNASSATNTTTTTTIATTPLIKYKNLLTTTTSSTEANIETDTSLTGNDSVMLVNGHYDVKAMMMKNNNNNGFNDHNELDNDKRIQSSQLLLNNNNKIDGPDSITNSNADDDDDNAGLRRRLLMIGKTRIANVNDHNNHDDVVDDGNDRLENASTKSLALLNNFKNNAKQKTADMDNNGDLVVDGLKQEKIETLVVDDTGDDELICLLCNTPLDLSKQKRNLCKICALNVCLNCSLFDKNNNCWICVVCQQQRTNVSECQSWVCKRLATSNHQQLELIHFINAKLHFNASKGNGNYVDNDGRCNKPDLTTPNGTNSTDNERSTTTKPADYHEKLIALRSDIELLLIKLLEIDTIDYTHIGYLFDDVRYYHLMESYLPTLANLLIAFQKSICLPSNFNNDNNDHVDCEKTASNCETEVEKLKELIQSIIDRCIQTFTGPLHTKSIIVDDLQTFISNCPTYEHLLANSVLNQIIEDTQSRFIINATKTATGIHQSSSIIDNNYPKEHHNLNHIKNAQHNDSVLSQQEKQNPKLCEDNNNNSRFVCTNYDHAKKKMNPIDGIEASSTIVDTSHVDEHDKCCDRPTICLTIQNNDEMVEDEELNGNDDYIDYDDDVDRVAIKTTARTTATNNDNDDDDDYDDVEVDVEDEDDFGLELNFEQSKVYFPEAGLDLIDSQKFSSIESNLSQDSGIKLIDNTQSWQDNWFFRKTNKDSKSYNQYHLNSDIHFGYMALALSESVPMLIPNPSQPINPMLGEFEADQVSDLSEHNSETGSIVFSSDEEIDGTNTDGEKHRNASKKVKETMATAKILVNNNTIDGKINIPPGDTTTVYIENRNKHRSDSVDDLTNQKRALPKISRKNQAIIQSLRWTKIKVPDFVPSELRTICSSIPNSQLEDLNYIPSFTLKPGNASIHSGIVAQFCCKASGLMPHHFAWYKDGHLIAASNDQRSLEEMENNRLARTFFGLRFTHKRFVESSCSAYRLIVYNDNECILELKKSQPSHAGLYSVVAYNHFGNDWCDFKLFVDRSHYTVSLNNGTALNISQQPMSPRPILRRPQHKTRKTITNTIKKNNSEPVAEKELDKANKMKENFKPLIIETIVEPKSIMTKSEGEIKQIIKPNVIQRTWQEREAIEMNNTKLLNIIKHRIPNDSINSDNLDGMIGDGNVGYGKCLNKGFSDHQRGQIIPGGISHVINNNNNNIISTVDTKTYAENGQMMEELDETVQFLNANPSEQQSSLDNVSSLNNSINIPVMPIAEREHRKWNNPEVNLVNNPYSPENIEKRAQQKLYSPELSYTLTDDEHPSIGGMADEEELVPEEKKKFFSSARDLERYKRDYYLPKQKKSEENTFSILNTIGNNNTNSNKHCKQQLPQTMPLKNHDNNELMAMKHQILNDHQQQPVTTSPIINSNGDTTVVEENTMPIKNFDVDDEPNSKDLPSQSSLSLEDCSIELNDLLDVRGNNTIKNDLGDNNSIIKYDCYNQSRFKEISQNKVKNLTSLFSSPASPPPNSIAPNAALRQSSESPTMQKSNSLLNVSLNKANTNNNQMAESNQTRPINMNSTNYAVYSLTGRSIPKVFREQNHKNLPRFTEQNRISLANEINNSTTTSTQAGTTSPTYMEEKTIVIDNNNHINHNGDRNSSRNSSHSLESNESSNSSFSLSSFDQHNSAANTALVNGTKHKNNSNRTTNEGTGAIKKRAVFWEKRIEGSQISDYQVQEVFPSMDGSEQTK